MNTLAHARQYVKNGWSVFPIPFGKKEPIIKWGEFRERYPTDAELVEWFDNKDSNIAIVCGKLSNLSVLDGDGVSGLAEIIRLKLTSLGTVVTGSGGKQLFFTHSGESNKWTSKNHQGLDSRGEGGYVVAPPSLHPNGNRYRWSFGIPNPKALPTWPAGLLTTPAAPTGVQVDMPRETEPWIVKALQGVSSGERHRVLVRLACYLIPRHHYDIVKQNLLDWNQKNQPPMPEAEVIKQLNDLVGRFKKGQYKTSYVPPKEEPKHEAIDISNARDSESYFLEQLQSKPLVVPDLPTGYPTLDAATFGIKRGSLFTIGARPGTGKTTLACNIAINLCKSGKRVLYFSTEMSREELLNKFAASEGDIAATRFEDKQFTDGDRAKLVQFVAQFKTYDLSVVRLFKPDQQSVKDAVAQHQPDVVIFDHIQHIETGDNEYAAISKFTKFLKQLAMEANIGVLVASQLHRGAAVEGVMPEIHHLKGCGTIEEEASVVVLMHDDQKKDDRPILIRIAKNRHGRTGDTTLLFKSDITKFEDMGVKVS